MGQNKWIISVCPRMCVPLSVPALRVMVISIFQFGFCCLWKYLQTTWCLVKKQFPSTVLVIVLKLDPIRFVLCSQAATNCEKVLRYFLCVCVLLCKYVSRKLIFVDIWSLLIISWSTNKSQTHILSCLLCAASLQHCVKEMLSTF